MASIAALPQRRICSAEGSSDEPRSLSDTESLRAVIAFHLPPSLRRPYFGKTAISCYRVTATSSQPQSGKGIARGGIMNAGNKENEVQAIDSKRSVAALY